ncbi:uncharacterized protein EI90DRAFT_41922 [Cantharellus anzutake]|uniref:uncharacterized protein n=1 Tax=Cantharellus anzutake TaxID=1750568 RepID=UPI001904F072|nr:uncharacterized protein EI90DRAFT_41922 [Cantharellus anzutake]KAF8344064.1 hypothetical protein EI90DRAFT_41922 [Cantharellus anzutake]
MRGTHHIGDLVHSQTLNDRSFHSLLYMNLRWSFLVSQTKGPSSTSNPLGLFERDTCRRSHRPNPLCYWLLTMYSRTPEPYSIHRSRNTSICHQLTWHHSTLPVHELPLHRWSVIDNRCPASPANYILDTSNSSGLEYVAKISTRTSLSWPRPLASGRIRVTLAQREKTTKSQGGAIPYLMQPQLKAQQTPATCAM